MLPVIADQTVDLLRAGASTNGYDDATSDDWSSPAVTVLEKCCSLQDESSFELLDGRTTIVTRTRFYGPYEPEITGADRIRHDGKTYKINGGVARPTGLGLDHQTCMLEVVS